MLADQPTFLREALASLPRRIYERRPQVGVGMFCLLVIGLCWATLLTYLNQVETTAADQASAMFPTSPWRSRSRSSAPSSDWTRSCSLLISSSSTCRTTL